MTSVVDRPRRAAARFWIVGLLGWLLSQPASALAPIQSWTTDTGVRVLLVSTPDLPIVDVRVVFDAGAARDGDTPGLARFTSGLLFDGAGSLDAPASNTTRTSTMGRSGVLT
ncbi:MAG TPA: hypothetical protein DCZ11_05100, partial [Gammaproteobacteria bacterium]|nr:hypothetical protein [Gammaproteobacteria bacterium]MCH77801.1 hypothetical protein [Gammaproteobacteria bacterium]